MNETSQVTGVSILSPEEKKKILKARAKELAKEHETQRELQDSVEVLEFKLANERYGIESAYVREAYIMKGITPVPCTPPFVLGITNVRGKILSAIDVKKLFSLPATGIGDRDRIIIVASGEMELGILVDAVRYVCNIPVQDIQPPPPTITGRQREYIKGITKDQMVILDMERLLSDKYIIVQEEVS